MDKSVAWMVEYLGFKSSSRILDLGCGPGLYSERLARLDHQVTGVDFSRRSIEYAREQASKKGLDITYLYQDYLNLEFKNDFELAILIYCDFGVLSDVQRRVILTKIRDALQKGGKLIFDVFTPIHFESFATRPNAWELKDEGGFWRAGAHLCLTSHFSYPEYHTYLEQVVVIDESAKVDTYRLWNRTYTREAIQDVLETSGFKTIGFFANAAGDEYSCGAPTLCVVAER